MIIGAGGIGSYLIPLLDKTKLYDMIVADPDKVETKNLTYQNFKSKENEMNKASVMSWNYESVTNCAYISYRADKNKHDTLLAGPDGSFSCQGNSWDGSTKGQHFSHVIAAGMGAEWIHRYFAKDDVADFKVVNV